VRPRSPTLPLALYAAATGLLEPLAPTLLRSRAKAGKEDPDRLGERLARPIVPRPDGPLVWLHGVSVGESLSLLPIVEALRARRPDLSLLVTSGTVTSAAILAKRLPAGVIHQFAPVDGPAAAARFLAHWRPAAGLLVESELWPNLILAAKARGVRLALLSARMTEASVDGWARAPACRPSTWCCRRTRRPRRGWRGWARAWDRSSISSSWPRPPPRNPARSPR
jgi:3-deoxy-D-manno-octulosonic-acid transferase